ncbi:hypothetical protein [Peterkaempfera sp. SMS 1(5)a]|uniref:hypothetical protein n=1 Tax=Peterkaempfera podocarpi TaxID=3232308 RepID=UPI00366E4BAC
MVGTPTTRATATTEAAVGVRPECPGAAGTSAAPTPDADTVHALRLLAVRLRLLAEETDDCAAGLRHAADTLHQCRTGPASPACPDPGAELRRRLRRRARAAPAAAERLHHASAAAEACAHRLESVLAHRAALARLPLGRPSRPCRRAGVPGAAG